MDLKLRLDVAKLKALQAALDKVDEAIKALPTPSQVRATMHLTQDTALHSDSAMAITTCHTSLSGTV